MVISFQVILSLKYAHGGRTCQASDGFVVSAFHFCPAGRRHTNNNSLCMLDLMLLRVFVFGKKQMVMVYN